MAAPRRCAIRYPAVAAASVLVAAATAPFAASAAEFPPLGERAPLPRVREVLNAKSFAPADLEGKVVLYEVFRTASEACRGQVGTLDQLDAKYRERGLVVVAVTDEGRPLVERFIRETGAKHAILIEESDSVAAFGVTSFPSTFLIDADGRLAWAGHGADFEDRALRRLLGEVRVLPTLPGSLDSIRRSMEKKEFAAARRALESRIAAEGTPADEKQAAEKALRWIDTIAARMLDGAADARREGDGWTAAHALRRVAAQFRGLDSGDRAKAGLDDLMKDEALRREVEAGDAWERLEDRLPTLKPEQAAQSCRQFEQKWTGTRAARRASRTAEGFEKRGRR